MAQEREDGNSPNENSETGINRFNEAQLVANRVLLQNDALKIVTGVSLGQAGQLQSQLNELDKNVFQT